MCDTTRTFVNDYFLKRNTFYEVTTNQVTNNLMCIDLIQMHLHNHLTMYHPCLVLAHTFLVTLPLSPAPLRTTTKIHTTKLF